MLYKGFAWTRPEDPGFDSGTNEDAGVQNQNVLLAFFFFFPFFPPPSCSPCSPTWQDLQMGCANKRSWRQPCDVNINLLCQLGEAPGNLPRNAFCSACLCSVPRGGICQAHSAAALRRARTLFPPSGSLLHVLCCVWAHRWLFNLKKKKKKKEAILGYKNQPPKPVPVILAHP